MNTNDVQDVRRLLRDADPLEPDALDGTARDERGQRDFARIIGTPPTNRAGVRSRLLGSRRRRVTTVAGTVAVLVGMGAGATAAGLVPSGVINAFHKGDRNVPIEQVRADEAVMAGQARLPSGTAWQLWIAPNKGGGACVYTRTVDPGGKHEDGSLECSARELPDKDPLTPIWISYKRLEGKYLVRVTLDVANGKWVAAKFGLDPRRARSVRVHLADGSTVSQPVTKGLSLGGSASAPTSLDVLDARGAVLGHYPVRSNDFCPTSCEW